MGSIFWLQHFYNFSYTLRLPQFERPMELAFLAGGIDAPGYFLRDVGFDYNVATFMTLQDTCGRHLLRYMVKSWRNIYE